MKGCLFVVLNQAPDGPQAHRHGINGFNNSVETEEGWVLDVERVVVGGAEVFVEKRCVGP